MLQPRHQAVLFVISISLVGCKAKGPTPTEASPPNAPDAAQDAGSVEAGSLALEPPSHWEQQPVSSSMRKAQFRIPGDQGDAELVVYYFGPQGAGSPQANIDRWVAQFKNPDGTPITDAEPVRTEVNGLEVTRVEVAGHYVAAMQPGAGERHDKAGQRLVAAIVETREGPYYLKLLGPDATVAENRSGFEQLLKSAQPSK